MKSLSEQLANRCRHFNGITNDTCDAGVRYETVRVPRADGMGYGLPCLKDHSEGCSCEKQSFPTAEEINAEITEFNQSRDRITTARKAIVDRLGGPWKKGMETVRGSMPCPVCKAGALFYSRAGINGHIHARCSTGECVAWME